MAQRFASGETVRQGAHAGARPPHPCADTQAEARHRPSRRQRDRLARAPVRHRGTRGGRGAGSFPALRAIVADNV